MTRSDAEGPYSAKTSMSLAVSVQMDSAPFLRDIFGERSRQPIEEALPFGSSQRLTHVRGAPHFQPGRQPSARRQGPFPD